jgi:hypothetical protein
MFSIDAMIAARASATCRSFEIEGRVVWRIDMTCEGEAAAEDEGAAEVTEVAGGGAALRCDVGGAGGAVTCGGGSPGDESEEIVVASVSSCTDALEPPGASVKAVLGVDAGVGFDSAGVAGAAGRRVLAHEVRKDMVSCLPAEDVPLGFRDTSQASDAGDILASRAGC